MSKNQTTVKNRSIITQNRDKRDQIVGYALIFPAILLLTLIGVVPILISIGYSFQYRVLTDPTDIHFVGLQNYITLFQNGQIFNSLKNTAVFAVFSMIFELAIGLAGALLMNSAKRFVGVIRTSVLIPWAIPGIIIAYMFSFMFNDQLGVANQILQTIGIIDSPISWLTHAKLAMLVIVFADTWKQFPYVSLMLLAGLQTIPKELYESASVDGVNKFQEFIYITLPNLKGVILIVLLFRTMGAIRIFDIVFGLTGGGPASSTSTLLYQAYNYLFGDMNFGLGSAMSTIVTILILICSVIYIKVLHGDD